MIPKDKDLYEKIKNLIYMKMPNHSIYRSMQIVKEYKAQGGKFEGKEKSNIDKWLKENWVSVNDYYRGQIIKCGNSDTKKKYNEYPLCRPIEIIKKMSKEEMKKLIDAKKNKKHVKSEKVLGTKKFNVK